MRHFESTYIEITSRCNLSCSFCPGTSRKKEFMSPELFSHIAEEFRDRTRFIFLHLMGEPLLHPDLARIMEISEAWGHRVNLTTNGTLIAEKSDILAGAPALRQVNVSLHSLEETADETYIDTFLADLFTFIRLTEKRENYYITLRLWNMDRRGFNKNNRHIAEKIEKEFNLDYSIVETAATYKGLRLGKNIFLNHDTAFQWPRITGPVLKEEAFCVALRRQIGILCDGTVVPCCLDSEGTINLGNIREQSLDKILAGKRARDLYNGFSRRQAVEELCKRCGYQTLFKKAEGGKLT